MWLLWLLARDVPSNVVDDLATRGSGMKGNQRVIEILNQLLTNELTAINQYFIHARMCENWGYDRLAKHVRHESIDEMKHADEVIGRILFLEGVPNLQRLGKINVGETVPEQFQLDLALEYDATKFLNATADEVRVLGDHGTFELLTRILRGEEEHIDWLETQLGLLKDLGDAHYLAQQMKKDC
jgi:bacterioferritin